MNGQMTMMPDISKIQSTILGGSIPAHLICRARI